MMKNVRFLRLFVNKSSPLTNVISKCHYILPLKPFQIKPLPSKPRLRPGKAQKKKITSSDSWTVVGYSTAEHYNLLALSEKILEQVLKHLTISDIFEGLFLIVFGKLRFRLRGIHELELEHQMKVRLPTFH